MKHHRIAVLSILLLVCAASGFANVRAGETADSGSTRIARWADDKKAAILLMFDDSMPSHVKNVIPELKKHGYIATFYVNPGKGEWARAKNDWEKTIPAAGMVYGNHTYTHQGIVNMANGEEEIGKCTDVILNLFPDQKKPRLISFGVPGVKQGAWLITKEQLKELLDKYHLVERPNARFAFIHLHSSEEMLKVVDKAIETGGMDCVAFHGVGGEWLSAPVAHLQELLDGLDKRRETVWVTDHISAYKYQTERDSAESKTLEATPKQIRVSLTNKADPQLFDQPLTLLTKVPAAWKKCEIAQGKNKVVVSVTDGTARYDALPDGTPITLSAAE